MIWISVKDRLPKEPDHVGMWKTYFTVDKGGAETCFYRGNGTWSSLISEGIRVEVTHWLEMPEGFDE